VVTFEHTKSLTVGALSHTPWGAYSIFHNPVPRSGNRKKRRQCRLQKVESEKIRRNGKVSSAHPLQPSWTGLQASN